MKGIGLRHRAEAAGGSKRKQRGATLIEAAIVTPVLFSLLLGIMEIGLAWGDALGLANATRAGARTASASGSDLLADFNILQSVNRESAALNRSDIQLVVVYKASSTGGDPTATCMAGTPTTGVCNVYTTADFAKAKTQFGCDSGELDRYWCPSSRKVTTSGAGADYIGVWMKVNHRWITKAFGTTKTLTDNTVIRLEPRFQ